MITNGKKPIGERVKRSDDHQRYLRAKEDPDHHDQHQCCALGVALANLQKNPVISVFCIKVVPCKLVDYSQGVGKYFLVNLVI